MSRTLASPLARLLLAGASLFSAAAAIAQESTGTAAPAAPATATDSTQAAPTPATGGTGVQEIVVTAQRRSENVQRSSLAIQVVGGESLARQGVSQVKNLSALVPGLSIANGGNQTQTFIRGVGDFSSTGLGQSAVAISSDGIYIADEASVSPLFYDTARVEVLKGPQGTLYGRNASAGAINIISNRPTQQLGGYISGEFGDYDAQRLIGVLNLPLTDTLALRAAGQYVHRNGYLSDGSDDDKQKDGRLELLWKPDSRFSALIVGDIEHAGGHGAGAVLLPRQPGTGKFTGAVDPINNAALIAAADVPPVLVVTPGAGPNPTLATENALNHDSVRDNTQRNISAEFNYDLGFADLTFLPAYRTSNDYYFGYTSGFPFSDKETTRQQSYELRLSKNTDIVKAAAGLYYFDNNQTLQNASIISLLVPSLNTRLNTDLGTKSYAAFGQATVSLADAFRVVGGIRYTHEHKTIDGTRTLVGLTGDTISGYDGAANFNAVNFKAGVEYDLTRTSMAYANVSTGFKAGGFNTFESANGISNTFRPEKLTSYLAGVRNRFFDNRLQFNVEGFYWKYKNSQQSHLTYDPAGDLQFETLNAGRATLYGADVDIVLKPAQADTITLTGEYLHSRFDQFIYQIPTANYSAASIGCAASAASAAGFTNIDCSGKTLPRAPRFSGTASYQHDFDLAGGAVVTADADLNFATHRYLAVDYLPVENAPGYVRENASLTFTPASKRWSVTGFVRNISNKAVYVGGVEAALSPGIFYSNVDAPRTFGGRVNFNF